MSPRKLTMILPGETEAGSVGMQPCRGIARWAHRDDAGERGKLLFALFFPKTHRIGRPSCLENPRPKGGIYQLTENALSPFQAEPAHGFRGQITSALSPFCRFDTRPEIAL
jgi:hypothetical protein